MTKYKGKVGRIYHMPEPKPMDVTGWGLEDDQPNALLHIQWESDEIRAWISIPGIDGREYLLDITPKPDEEIPG